MIIWINGAFGSGKTTCAYELHWRLPNSYVYDPENIGFVIRDNIPDEMKQKDFQDYEQWRSFNLEMLHKIYSEYDGTIIVPMTIVNRTYYDEIIGGLRELGLEIRHFILYADEETLVKRLNKRLEWGNSWGKRQISRCLTAFDSEIREEKILTDELTVGEVVEEIGKRSDLRLLDDNRGMLKRKLDNFLTTVKHIRS